MKISLVVPTRSRAVYLRETLHTVAAAAALCPVEVEVVVSDNASEDDTPQVCRDAGLANLVYLRQPQRLSMRQNFEAALNAATGSHIVFIGDDDGVAPQGFARLAEMAASGDHEILKWRVVNYIWPDPGRGGRGSVLLRTNKLSGRVRRIDPQAQLADFIDGRFGTYQSGGMIYHGCIRRDLIDRVRAAQDGTYFRTSCPDVYASVANLLHARNPILAADIPVTIGGASPRSNGVSGKEYTQTAQATQGSEYARFLSETSGDPFLGRTPATCASINLVVIDALQLAHGMAGRPLALNEAAWIGRLTSEFAGLAHPVAVEAKDQAGVLLGKAADAIPLPAATSRSTIVPPPVLAEVATKTDLSLRLGRVRLQGGPAMAGMAPAAAAIDAICGGGVPFARLPRTPFGMLHGMVQLLRRAKAWRQAQL